MKYTKYLTELSDSHLNHLLELTSPEEASLKLSESDYLQMFFEMMNYVELTTDEEIKEGWTFTEEDASNWIGQMHISANLESLRRLGLVTYVEEDVPDKDVIWIKNNI